MGCNKRSDIILIKLLEREKMGAFFKGNNSKNYRHKGKPYALMLLLAFGAVILGVMILHMIREKRVFSVLIKDKDHQLLTLHLLIQREKEFSKEARRKIEGMKTKVYSLRSQKLDLDRKLWEMESIITSLRDERKVIESALEKKNAIKMLTQGKMNSSNVVLSNVASLKTAIKMKRAEIEDLKLRLEKSVHFNSGSDTVMHQNINHKSNQIMGEHGRQDESIILRVTKPDKLNDAEGAVAGTMTEAALTEQENTKQENTENGGAMESTNISENESTKAIDASDDTQNQESRGQLSFHRSGLDFEKLDEFDSEHDFTFRARKKHFKGKRWRESVRNRRLGHSLYTVTTHPSNEATSIGNMGVVNQYDHAEPKTKQAASVDQLVLSVAQKNKGQIGDGSQVRKKEPPKEDKGQGERPALVSDGDQGQIDNENAKPILVSDGFKQKAEEIISNQSQAHEAGGKLEKMQATDVDKHENSKEQQKVVAEKDDAGAEDLEDAETQEPEIDKADIQRFSESEETEETEF